MRQLDPKPHKKLRNPRRHLRALETWSRSFAGFFPTTEMAHEGLWEVKIPVFEKLVSPPQTTRELQKHCAQLMIDAAERLRDARPAGCEDQSICVFLTLPDMFLSRIAVALEPRARRLFGKSEAGRQGDADNWHEYFAVGPERFQSLDLQIPEGFTVQGTGLRAFEADWMSEPEEWEEWVIGELGKA